jgi:L-ribulose-5-phosphate 4-epimerase
MTPIELREQVAAANAAIARAGLVTLSFGNVSGVDRERGVLAIKASGVPCDRCRPEDVVTVSLEDGTVVDGSLRPSSDTPTHRLLYREHSSIGGIVHTHSSHATAWAQARRAIPCLGTTHADYFRTPVPVSRAMDAAEISGEYEWETGRVIGETLRAIGSTPEDTPAVLVASHGPFAWGATPEAAVEVAVALEAVAEAAFRTLVIDPAATEIGAELLTRHFHRKHGPGAYYGQPPSTPDEPR